MPLQSGTLFGPYQILSSLGAGGMGEVYRARDTRLSREVALKVLPPQTLVDPVRRQRFSYEAQTTSGLNHPNIAVVFDVNLDSEVPYIVSELIEGESLRHLIARGPVPLRKFLDIAVQIAAGLAAAHEAGIVHRDLKPENVLFTRDGHVKIIDFGLSKTVPPQLTKSVGDTVTIALTTDGMVLGTVSYMSPEQASGAEIDTRSDIFSFGVILFELATGKHPYPRSTVVEQMAAIIRDEAPPLPSEMPLALTSLIDRCLAKDAADRYQSTKDLYLDLRMLRDHGIIALSGSQKQAASALAVKRPRWRSWHFMLLSAIAASLLTLFLMPVIPSSRALQFTPLATGPEFEDAAAWSPQGNSVAYHAAINGVRQLFVRTIDAASPIQVTRCSVDCDLPEWSPDGARLFFRSRNTVWVVGAAGGEPQPVVADIQVFAISQDGKTLAFERSQSNPPRFSIWLSSPPGAAPVRYTPGPFEGAALGSGTKLAFSPDGKKLLFWGNVADIGRNAELWLLPLPPGSSPPHNILATTLSSQLVRGMSWMPDSRQIVLASTAPPDVFRSHLYVADTRRETMRLLVGGIGFEALPAISRDGQRLAYTAMDYNSDVIELPIDGSPVRPLIVSSRIERSPGWSPVAREFAYVTDRRGVEEIWIHTLDQNRDQPIVVPRQLPDASPRFVNSPAFSPDGERIAFIRRGAGGLADSQGVEIWIAGVAGGAVVKLTGPQGGTQWAPTWSPDGHWIAYFESNHKRLMKARVGAGGDAETIVPCLVQCLPEWSPTNEWIAYNTAEGVALTSPDGKLTRVVRRPAFTAMVWSQDGASLYGVAPDNGRLRLVMLDVATGRERVLNTFDSSALRLDQVYSPGVRLSRSADGKILATTQLRVGGDLWMLQNFNPPSGTLARLFELGRQLFGVGRGTR